MVGILLITHGALGEACCARRHTLGRQPERAEHLSVTDADAPESCWYAVASPGARRRRLGRARLTDMFGATPANVAAKLLQDGKVEGLSGANLPMLVRRSRTAASRSPRWCRRRAPAAGRAWFI